jgi:hypothetical protein
MKTEINENLGKVNMARRSFLRYAGAGVAGIGVLAASSCAKHHVGPVTPGSIDIGSGDLGILNFAYALEQLEAAFYLQVTATPYAGISSYETSLLTDIRDHEVCHRNFFKAALGSNAIPALSVNFSAINFGDRTSVLNSAKAFEDTGVTAYDGAGYLFQSATYLTLAGKIVSVEARHASLIRNLIAPGSFVDSTVVDSNSVNISKTIAQVLPIANTFLTTKVSAASFGYVAS